MAFVTRFKTSHKTDAGFVTRASVRVVRTVSQRAYFNVLYGVRFHTGSSMVLIKEGVLLPDQSTHINSLSVHDHTLWTPLHGQSIHIQSTPHMIDALHLSNWHLGDVQPLDR